MADRSRSNRREARRRRYLRRGEPGWNQEETRRPIDSTEYRGRTEDEWRYGRGDYDYEWTTGSGRRPTPEHIVDPQLEGGFGEPETSYSEYRSPIGPYYGRGPKNYQRSNERIAEEINDRLTQHGYLDATNIQVEVNNGQVVLGGLVDSRRARRLAEDIADSVAGVSHIINKLHVEQNR